MSATNSSRPLFVQRVAILLPLPAVEGLDREALQVHPFKAADIDVNLIRVRTRNVVGVNAADRTKVVFGGFGVELIKRDHLCGSKQAELPGLDDQVQEPFFAANRTIALNDPVQVGGDLEPHPPAMAASLIGWHKSPPRCFALPLERNGRESIC